MNKKLLLLPIIATFALGACSNHTNSNNDFVPENISDPENRIDSFMQAGTKYRTGDFVYNYSFVDMRTGEVKSIKEALQTKKLIVINLWATWCTYCLQEFPYVNAAYEARDDVEFFALSYEVEKTVTNWVNKNKTVYSFPVGKDVNDLFTNSIRVEGYPTSLYIDRYGRIDYMEAGAYIGTTDLNELGERVITYNPWNDIFDYYTSNTYKTGQASRFFGA